MTNQLTVLCLTRVTFILTDHRDMGEQTHIVINIVQYPRITQATHSDNSAEPRVVQ